MYQAYLTWVALGNTATPYVAPMVTLQQRFSAAIATGCAIVSTGTPALNGIYGLDDHSLLLMAGEQGNILAHGTFTNGATSRAWLDIGGQLHILPTVAAGTALFTAVAGYYDALTTATIAAEVSGTWTAPAIPVTIP